MYADDIVLLSNSAGDLQKSLDCLLQLCQRWNLKVNINKTKVIIFNKSGKMLKCFTFSYDGQIVEIVNEYKHLGIILNHLARSLKLLNIFVRKHQKLLLALREL